MSRIAFWGEGARIPSGLEIREEKGRRVRYLTAFGETRPFSAWLRDPRCLVTEETLARRVIELKWSPELALATKPWRCDAAAKPRLAKDTKPTLRVIAPEAVVEDEGLPHPCGPSGIRLVVDRNTRRKFFVVPVDGRLRKVGDLARERGMPHTTLSSRLRAGWTLEDALTRPVSTNACRAGEIYKFRGEKLLLAELARHPACAVGLTTLRSRLTDQDWPSLELAVTTPPGARLPSGRRRAMAAKKKPKKSGG